MTGRDDCLNELRALVSQADRHTLAAAQDVLLRFAFGKEALGRRGEAFDGLVAALTRDDRTGFRSREQHAFHLALLTMIERTRTRVESREAEAPADRRAPQSRGVSP